MRIVENCWCTITVLVTENLDGVIFKNGDKIINEKHTQIQFLIDFLFTLKKSCLGQRVYERGYSTWPFHFFYTVKASLYFSWWVLSFAEWKCPHRSDCTSRRGTVKASQSSRFQRRSYCDRRCPLPLCGNVYQNVENFSKPKRKIGINAKLIFLLCTWYHRLEQEHGGRLQRCTVDKNSSSFFKNQRVGWSISCKDKLTASDRFCFEQKQRQIRVVIKIKKICSARNCRSHCSSLVWPCEHTLDCRETDFNVPSFCWEPTYWL